MFGNSLSCSRRMIGGWREGKTLCPSTHPPQHSPPRPPHNLLETGFCVFSSRVTCPWKINRYLFRKLSKAFRNLTLVERERTCCWTPSLPKCDVATVAPLLEGRKELCHGPLLQDVPSISTTIRPNKAGTCSPLSRAVCDVVLHMEERCFLFCLYLVHLMKNDRCEVSFRNQLQWNKSFTIKGYLLIKLKFKFPYSLFTFLTLH